MRRSSKWLRITVVVLSLAGALASAQGPETDALTNAERLYNSGKGVNKMSITKPQRAPFLTLPFVSASIATAQVPFGVEGGKQDTQSRDYWIDPATKLMWAGKDNGSNVTWGKAMKYCRQLHLAGYSDWRLASLEELEGIFDSGANVPGRAGPGTGRAFTWHVKGNLFLTGNQWSSDRRTDDRGRPVGYAWRYDFNEGREFDGDELSFSTNKRALCVRNTAK